MVNTKEIVDAVIGSVSDENGNVNFEQLKEVIAALREEKKAREEEAKAIAKEKRNNDKETAEAENRAWADDNLKEGDRVRWADAKGDIHEATVGKQKEGAKRLHVIKDEGTYDKRADSYVPYYQIICEVVENSEEVVA